MKVSVVIPAWNAAETLAATLDSLLAQTFAGWEAIVVDDGSDDETASIAREYAARDDRIQSISQARAGEAGARNTGVEAARYEWLLFLDADDWIAPEHLERLTGLLSADPGLDGAFCRYARVAADGTRVPDPYFPPSGRMFDIWARRSAFPVHACVVRRSIVREVGGFDTSLVKSTDWDLWQRVARTGARFGGVDEVLAFYRMSAGAASLDALGMLRDGLEVIRRGHRPDPRVPRPDPEYAGGADPAKIPTQAWYLLSWCAGLEIGAGGRPERLLEHCDVDPFPGIHGPAVARCIFDAAPLPLRQPPSAWEGLWPRLRPAIEAFFEALADRCGSPDLPERARAALAWLVLGSAPARAELALLASEERDRLEAEVAEQARWIRHHEDINARLEQQVRACEEERVRLGNRMSEVELELQDLRTRVLQAEGDRLRDPAVAACGPLDKLMAEKADLARARQRLEAERNALLEAPERRLGSLLLNRFRLRTPIRVLESIAAATWHRSVRAELRRDRWAARDSVRVMASVCWNFPIHSHTFVYQELDAMLDRGFSLRLVYSRDEGRDRLHDRFARLWPVRRKLVLHRPLNERDFEHYRSRFPERVEELVEKLGQAAGMSRKDLLEHGNFLQAFSFTRLVESYRPDYLHTYFFYDRSLMALVASYILGIPRGISCYSDHVLDDYELKVVPLHLELADVVVATSRRIRRELIEIAPAVPPDKIIVKPNGIATAFFPELERSDPAPAQPFRVVSVSRIEPKKGLLDLVDAIAMLRERGIPAEAHIVGDADEQSPESVEYRRRLDERITHLGLWGAVHLEGRQGLEGILRYLGMAHVFAAPYVETASGDKDGIPTSLLEAMSTGLAAVATDAGSITEVIDDGVHGFVVPQRDAAALADAIQALLLDPERRRAMGREAAHHVRAHYDVAVCESILHDRVLRLVGDRSAA